ncbi:MAG: hypothetical protein ABI640_18535 [Gammaproteobacteria bacterium]
MRSNILFPLHALLVTASMLALTSANAQDALHKNSAAMVAKVARMQDAAAHPRPAKSEPVRTAFTDAEANAYLQVEGPKFLPTGITEPNLSTGEGGRVTARATIDLDAIGGAKQRGLLDPLAFVTGAVEVVATGFVVARDGVGMGSFESATVAGIPVPKRIAEEILRFYTRTPEHPQGFGLDDSFDLPAQIRSVNVEAGRVTVTQ